MSETMVPRFLEQAVAEKLAYFPVVMVEGPRQSGKTTLVKRFVGRLGEYYSCDDALIQQGIAKDGDHFLSVLGDKAVIDEIQEWPRCTNAIKREVDDNPGDGRYLLTGSSTIRARRGSGDSLAGRACLLTLWPLSQAEIRKARPHFFLDYVFGDRTDDHAGKGRQADLGALVMTGGYPRLRRLKSARQRAAWLRHYCASIAERDIPEIEKLRSKVRVIDILRDLATSCAGMLSIDRHSRKLGMAHATATRIVGTFEDLHIISQLGNYRPATGLVSLTKRRKLYFNDSGMLAAVLGLGEADWGRGLRSARATGMLFETFVYSEIAKQCHVCDAGHRLAYWADQKHEVDLVIGLADSIVGVEIKSSSRIPTDAFAGLKRLADLADNMQRGVVVYAGDKFVTFSYRTASRKVPMQAIPVSWLWMSGRTG